MEKTRTVTLTGICVEGTAKIKLWDGTEGFVSMERYYLPLAHITPKNILRCVNDGGFGCESIVSAEIDIMLAYDNGWKEYERTIIADSEIHSKYFLGWQHLRSIGIRC